MDTNVARQLIDHEGMRLKPYRCPAGRLTIGCGRNLDDKGLAYEEAYFLLMNDIGECQRDLQTIIPNFFDMVDGRRFALTDLRFNVGPAGFRGFKRLIDAVKRGNWAEAAAELKDSSWWSQVQETRRNKLYQQLLTGVA